MLQRKKITSPRNEWRNIPLQLWCPSNNKMISQKLARERNSKISFPDWDSNREPFSH